MAYALTRRAVADVGGTDASLPVYGASPFDALYTATGARYGVDAKLLRAIAIVESGENPSAFNDADVPGYGGSTGLMQVMCDANGPDSRCRNNLPAVKGWPPLAKELYDPETNLDFAAQILAWNIRQYGTLRGIAVYNRWDSRNDPPEGPFGNQNYVDRVMQAYALL
jgi:soluble lytic murein transglycosylase-like protein